MACNRHGWPGEVGLCGTVLLLGPLCCSGRRLARRKESPQGKGGPIFGTTLPRCISQLMNAYVLSSPQEPGHRRMGCEHRQGKCWELFYLAPVAFSASSKSRPAFPIAAPLSLVGSF